MIWNGEHEKSLNQRIDQQKNLKMQNEQLVSRDKEISELKKALHFSQDSEKKLKTENEELKRKLSSREHELAEARMVMEAMR